MNYPRNPQRRAQNWGGGGYGGNRRQYSGPRQGNGQGQYKPNTAKLRPNHEKASPKHPDFKGVGNVMVNGQQVTVFVSLWFNTDQNTGEENVSLQFTEPNSPQQQQRYPQQGRPQFNEGQPVYDNGYGGYNEPQQPNRAHQPGGAMSRARPIPPAQYQEQGGYDDAPPPNGPEDYNVSYDGGEPPY